MKIFSLSVNFVLLFLVFVLNFDEMFFLFVVQKETFIETNVVICLVVIFCKISSLMRKISAMERKFYGAWIQN